MADAGQVDHDEEEFEETNVLAEEQRVNVFQRMQLEEPLNSSKYELGDKLVRFLESGYEFTVKLFQTQGFDRPYFVKDKEGLGMKVPCPSNFGLNEVRAAVGSRRLLDVMDVNKQQNFSMTMKEWHKYYETPHEERRNLYNVISLEFSNTKLDPQISAPRTVRQIDWIDKVWPRHLKEMQVEATNSMDDMM